MKCLAIVFILPIILCPYNSSRETVAYTAVKEKQYKISELETKPYNEEDEKSISCLAKNMYYEARNQSYEGLMAVAFVSLNRVHSNKFPSALCDVVYQRTKYNGITVCQFSWTCGKEPGILNKELWGEIYRLAEFVYHYKSKITDITNGALFYHSKNVNPSWARVINRCAVIGDHIFYRRI